MREAFRRRGVEAWSCDLSPAEDGSSYHLQADIHAVLQNDWDLAIFHPECTYLTASAEWAYGDGPYHQKLRVDTLVSLPRRRAREAAIREVKKLYKAPIRFIAIENPVGILSSRWRKPDQIIQPYRFGENASKATCFWLKGLPKLHQGKSIRPERIIRGNPRWANQAPCGASRIGPGEGRMMDRARTYRGIADACADQWGAFVANFLRISRGEESSFKRGFLW